jgi:hypothetical protein
MSYKGNFVTYLYDENKEAIFAIGFYSWSELEHELDIVVSYRDATETWHSYTRPSTLNPNFDDICSIIYEPGVGLTASIGTEGSGVLVNDAQWDFEPDRTIKYIGIQWRRGSGIYLDYYVDDIGISGETIFRINSPDDIEIEYGMLGYQIQWDSNILNPDNYTILVNDVEEISLPWDGSEIVYELDALSPGLYEIEIYCYSTVGDVLYDSVIVTIEPSVAPTINSPADVEYEVGTTDHWIIWTPSDDYPAIYSVYLDGMTIDSGIWDGSSISVNVDGHEPGTWEYSLIVLDSALNSNNDIVLVTVIDSISIDHPDDIVYSVGATGNWINWTPVSSTPNAFAVITNDSVIDSGFWDGSPISINVDNLAIGVYNYSIVVINDAGGVATDWVLVTVTEAGTSGTDTGTTTGTGSDPGTFDTLIIIISVGSIGVIVVVIGAICRNKPGSASIPNPGYEW